MIKVEPHQKQENSVATSDRSESARRAWQTRIRNEAERIRRVTASKKITFQGKALTVKQPWASAIAFGGKDVENRDWRTHYRGRIAIHAGATMLSEGLELMCRRKRGDEQRTLLEQIKRGRRRYFKTNHEGELIPASHIVAIAMLVDCVESSSSPWFVGDYGWVLEGVMPIQPVPCSGDLSLWDCEFTYRPLPRR